jgi:hypothetical protein
MWRAKSFGCVAPPITGVNAMDGRPFFVLSCAVDPGLLTMLREQIVPRLKADAPNQPSVEELQADRLLSRFTIVFDREGYSPSFFAQMKEQRIAVVTYRKYSAAPWAEQEFRIHQVRLVSGDQVQLQLAERGVQLSNDLWVREVRHRSPDGHQSALLSTDYRSDLSRIAAAMFARWSQENFFKYMRQHYNLDRLIEYGTEPIPDTTRVVNPARRQLESQIRRQNGLLSRELVHSQKSSCPKNWSPHKWKLISKKRVTCSRSLKNAGTKSRNLKINAKPIQSTSRSKICPSKIDFSAYVQRKNTSSTPSNSSLIGLRRPS